MLVDESILTDRTFDVVVIGGGAAGLTLAQGLEAVGRHILVVEAGDMKETRRGRSDLAGELAAGSSHPRPDLYRVRALGGTSRIWGGRCIPFDPIDFEKRDWVDHSGWPINYRSVAAYYPAALEAAEAGAAAFDPAVGMTGEQAELVAGLDGVMVETTLERFSRPSNFWTRFGSVLRESKTIDILPGMIATEIGLRSDGRSVEGIDVITRSGARGRIRASTYVLAGGGLETTRLLLASNKVKQHGIGNGGDRLGRYYMSHLCTTAGIATFRPRGGAVASGYSRDAEGIYVRRRLWLTERAQREYRLLNTTFRTHLPEPGNPVHNNAILSAMFLAKSFVQREYAAKLSESRVGGGDYARHVGNIARQPLSLARFARSWIKDRILADRKLPSVALDSPQHRYVLEFHAEQAPNPASRVSLSSARDRHGQQRLHIDWRLGSQDIESLQHAHALLGRALKETGTGTLVVDHDVIADRARRFGIVGGHHIGTTRMSDSEATGVVDGDCRVHGTENLYVLSASVFPTSGQANPTLTLLALTLRMADHLAGVLTKKTAANVETAAA